jgi:hypothetical protein
MLIAMSSSSRSSTPSLSSDDSDLPSTSYDGSHLSWRMFRQQVLAAHQIRILDAPPKDLIPVSFLKIVEAASRDTSRFDSQKSSFWNQVTNGRGFGPSPIFPPNLLPALSSEQLSRCMVPAFGSREALPERSANQVGPLYELAMPHSGLGCGFSTSAFTAKELSALPQFLHATGTVVSFDTGYVSPGAMMYCPFLTFERAYGNKEHRVEAANNQCAIAGTYCVRAYQILYARAHSATRHADLPVSFSCTIDNSFAVLNLHWVDLAQGQTYCMAPLCQFDLSKDVHFSKFLVWTQAVGEWALTEVLPRVKDALDRVQRSLSPVTPAPFFPIRRAATMPPAKLRLDTGPAISKDELLLSSLKTAFGDIPWRFDNAQDSGMSSSTASWGSPMVSDLTFSNLNYPSVHPPRSNAISAPNSSVVARKRVNREPTSATNQPIAYMQSQEGLWQRRFNQAMGEIKDLQTQLQAFQKEMEGLKESIRGEVTSKVESNPPTVTPTPVNAVVIDFPSVTNMEVASLTHQTTMASQSLSTASIMSVFGLAGLSSLIVARYVPDKTSRVIAYGCAAVAALVTLLRPADLQLGSFSTRSRSTAGVLGLWPRW